MIAPFSALCLFAEIEAVTPGEITFLKWLGIFLMLLWVAYLLKELMVGHKPDPQVAMLTQAVSTLTAAMAATGARMEALERRQNELVQMQRTDTAELFKNIKDWNESIQKVLRDHEHDIASAANQTRKPR